jgi:hypothetical protein
MKIGSTGLKEKESIVLNRWLVSESLPHDLTYLCVSVHVCMEESGTLCSTKIKRPEIF